MVGRVSPDVRPPVDGDVGEAAVGPQGGAVEPWVGQAIRTAGGGQPSPDQLRSSMEQALGADLRDVRLHTDTQADQLNDALQSHAFTTGRDIFFRRGAYAPGTRDGQSLLAHELTHVVQQGGTATSAAKPNGAIQRKMTYDSKQLMQHVVPPSPGRQEDVDALYDEICEAAKDYDVAANEADLREQLDLLQRIEVLTSEWRASYKHLPKVHRTRRKKAANEIKVLLQEVRKEIDSATLSGEWRAQYMERLVATTWARHPTGFKARSKDERFSTNQSTESAFNFVTTSGLPELYLYLQIWKTAKEREPKLTDQEFAAIRLFTAADYKYINPTLAKDASWLATSIADLTEPPKPKKGDTKKAQESTWADSTVIEFFKNNKDPTQARAKRLQLQTEGMQHARQALSGLRRAAGRAGDWLSWSRPHEGTTQGLRAGQRDHLRGLQ